MRGVLNALLTVAAFVLVFMLYKSITGPIEFDKEKAIRDAKVIERLKDIREAQLAFSKVHDRRFAGSFDELIGFVKNEKIPTVMKVGNLTDDQLEKGLTEEKAMAMINKAKKTGNWKEVEEAGLKDFRRDTTWTSVEESLFKNRAGFVADSLRYVPFGGGATFTLDTASQISKSGAPIYLFESKVPFDVYLNGLDKQEIINIKDEANKMNKYAGLQVGSIETANNSAGNWE